MKRPYYAVLLLSSVLVAMGCGSPPVPAPTGYKTWKATDGTFQLEYPDTWEAKGGGKRGIQWARIEKEGARIYVNINTTDSLMGDIAGTGLDMVGGAPGDVPEELSPAASVHKMNQARVFDSQNYKNYQEQSGEPFKTMLGEAWRTEFTGKFGGRKVHGWRATILGHNKGVNVLCHCSESDWASLSPAFKKILDGMKPVGY